MAGIQLTGAGTDVCGASAIVNVRLNKCGGRKINCAILGSRKENLLNTKDTKATKEG